MKYSRLELAELLGVQKKTISAWCSKSKRTIIPDVDNPDMIDDSIEKNRKFIKRKLVEKSHGIKHPPIAKKKGSVTSTNPNSQIANKQKSSKSSQLPKQPKTEPEYITPLISEENRIQIEAQNEIVQLELEIKKTRLRKEQKDLELKQIQIEKQQNDNITTEEAIELFKALSQEKDKALLSKFELLIQSICDRESVPTERTIRHKAKVIQIINDINEKGRLGIEENL